MSSPVKHCSLQYHPVKYYSLLPTIPLLRMFSYIYPQNCTKTIWNTELYVTLMLKTYVIVHLTLTKVAYATTVYTSKEDSYQEQPTYFYKEQTIYRVSQKKRTKHMNMRIYCHSLFSIKSALLIFDRILSQITPKSTWPLSIRTFWQDWVNTTLGWIIENQSKAAIIDGNLPIRLTNTEPHTFLVVDMFSINLILTRVAAIRGFRRWGYLRCGCSCCGPFNLVASTIKLHA